MLKSIFIYKTDEQKQKARDWQHFLTANKFSFDLIKSIDMTNDNPSIYDQAGRKFCIDFKNDKLNYHKKKASLKSELISKAVGSGRMGMRVFDLTAGLAIDSIFLAQMGYQVEALERNALIYLCLQNALQNETEVHLKIHFGEALEWVQNNKIETDIIYFDPMFPQKKKSALPRQEMLFFKEMVGSDADAENVFTEILNLKKIKRIVVKRPLSAPAFKKPNGQLAGKLIRYDIYGAQS